MRFFSRWLSSQINAGIPGHLNYESLLRLESETCPGVKFSIRKMSLSQRIALSSQVRELTLRNEFLRSGDLNDQLEATLAARLVQKLYVEWAVVDIRGLTIDGQAPSIALLIERGPEALVAEMAEAIQTHLELSDAERKNS